MTYLTGVGSIGGFVAYIYALRHLPVSTVSLYAYINPVIAVILGALVLNEPFGAAHRARVGPGARRARLGAGRVRAPRPSACGSGDGGRCGGGGRRFEDSMTTMLPRIKHLPPNAAGVAFFLCCGKDLRHGRGGEFISVTLQDSTGQLPGRIFDNVEQLRDEFEAGEFVRVQGRSEVHNGRLQLVIEKIRRVIKSDDDAGFREEDCVRSAPRPIGEMWEELEAVVQSVSDPFVRTLLERTVHAREARLRVWPAAVTVHHAYRGGFLEHVLKVAATARFLASAYGANVDLVIAGALLHDIGKLDELEHDVYTRYSRRWQLDRAHHARA